MQAQQKIHSLAFHMHKSVFIDNLKIFEWLFYPNIYQANLSINLRPSKES